MQDTRAPAIPLAGAVPSLCSAVQTQCSEPSNRRPSRWWPAVLLCRTISTGWIRAERG